MPDFNLLGQRLGNQRLATTSFQTPEQVVAWRGAVQAQDVAGARWALGLRANGLTDDVVEQAFDSGRILRTHVLRPTWHFVSPADIRWMLALTGPRVHGFNAYYYRKLELDRRTLSRSHRVFECVLQGGRHLTRLELADSLDRNRIPACGQRLAALVMHAELEGVVCSGPRRGNQFTYALLEERVARAPTLKPNEALAELTRRYFASHGPATVRDFAWWSGLSVREVKTGIAMIKPALDQRVRGDLTYWVPTTNAPTFRIQSTAYLLPTYDEYLIAYKDRDEVVAPSRARSVLERAAGEFGQHLVIDGRLEGSWRRVMKSASMSIEVLTYARLSQEKTRALNQAARRHAAFLKMPVTVTQSRATT